MNYLGHLLVAEKVAELDPAMDDLNFMAGVIGPDRVGIADCRLLRLKTWGQRAFLSPSQVLIHEGVDFHIKTDIIFGEHPLTRLLKQKFRDEIAPDFIPESSRRSGMVADIGTELLLDGVIMRKWPNIANIYYETLASVDDFTLAAISKQRLKFVESIRRNAVRIPDYSDPAVVANILQWRVRNRPKLAFGNNQAHKIGLALLLHQQNVDEYAETVLFETSDRLASEHLIRVPDYPDFTQGTNYDTMTPVVQ